ncbi:hypothetical protein Bamb_3136 [Burkholderia ambifaria AMMD]|uniref:Uncharacterized protein n=1 Tax=Burkholderia ambifaria (strain ATCC BAA-244 / DSM 16087 / CCUG 44356 / LMG 19182 / AMMD) TaxID=339670 RepID=Q0BAY1_BURCM|nr:hypothetical protein Bamb_3136 [Burkholderia ambifaria AMMD]
MLGGCLARQGFHRHRFFAICALYFLDIGAADGDRPDTAPACDSVTIRARWSTAITGPVLAEPIPGVATAPDRPSATRPRPMRFAAQHRFAARKSAPGLSWYLRTGFPEAFGPAAADRK